jgi:S1-C subfamily serine protease
MPRLTSSKLGLIAFLSLLTLITPLRAQSPVDDALFKQALLEGLTDIYESRSFPAPAAIRRQLDRKNKFNGSFPIASSEVDVESAKRYETARKATLVIGHLYLCDKCDNWHTTTAGGVIISEDGLALTNHHVLAFERASIYGAMTSDGRVYAIEEVLAASKKNDVALVRIRTNEKLPFVSMASSAPIGTPVFAVSHPDSHFYTLTKGYVSRYSVSPHLKIPRLEITADFARGSSGSGIFNDNGSLVGLIASTKSVYYNEENNIQQNLQMVIKSCVPLSGIKALFSESKSETVLTD